MVVREVEACKTDSSDSIVNSEKVSAAFAYKNNESFTRHTERSSRSIATLPECQVTDSRRYKG